MFAPCAFGPALREHVIEGRLQSLAAQRGADEILVLGCRVGAKLEFIVDHPQSVRRAVSVDAVHAAADGQPFKRSGQSAGKLRGHVGFQTHRDKPGLDKFVEILSDDLAQQLDDTVFELSQASG